MIDSTGRQGLRLTQVLRASGVALLLVVASACGATTSGGDPRISADGDRTSEGALESLRVTGSNFTPNGTVLVTLLLAGPAENASPYVEEEIQADGDGRITYERQPAPCPQPAARGSYVTVTARDMTSGISGSDTLSPGGAPDCTG